MPHYLILCGEQVIEISSIPLWNNGEIFVEFTYGKMDRSDNLKCYHTTTINNMMIIDEDDYNYVLIIDKNYVVLFKNEVDRQIYIDKKEEFHHFSGVDKKCSYILTIIVKDIFEQNYDLKWFMSKNRYFTQIIFDCSIYLIEHLLSITFIQDIQLLKSINKCLICTELNDFIIVEENRCISIKNIDSKLIGDGYVIFEHRTISNKICIITE